MPPSAFAVASAAHLVLHRRAVSPTMPAPMNPPPFVVTTRRGPLESSQSYSGLCVCLGRVGGIPLTVGIGAYVNIIPVYAC